MDKEIKKAFKRLTNICFLVTDERIVFVWGEGSEKGIPDNKIFIGRRGSPRPDYTFSPYDIKELVCTNPGLFRQGTLTLIGADGTALITLPFKDRSNIKSVEKFNQCLALYKQYNLGK